MPFRVDIRLWFEVPKYFLSLIISFRFTTLEAVKSIYNFSRLELQFRYDRRPYC